TLTLGERERGRKLGKAYLGALRGVAVGTAPGAPGKPPGWPGLVRPGCSPPGAPHRPAGALPRRDDHHVERRPDHRRRAHRRCTRRSVAIGQTTRRRSPWRRRLLLAARSPEWRTRPSSQTRENDRE